MREITSVWFYEATIEEYIHRYCITTQVYSALLFDLLSLLTQTRMTR